ncbi:hypothetical protein ACRRVB_02945 [Candidatus Cardinium hertigii]|uniref:hypothetical protein n=1 Tax=Candidatus Cardinium hertigii TaxID=247481 RepID=UPI003D7D9AAB
MGLTAFSIAGRLSSQKTLDILCSPSKNESNLFVKPAGSDHDTSGNLVASMSSVASQEEFTGHLSHKREGDRVVVSLSTTSETGSLSNYSMDALL